MKSTTSISISDDVLTATKQWAKSEHRPLSHHIEMILGSALARRITPTRRKAQATKKKEATHA